MSGRGGGTELVGLSNHHRKEALQQPRKGVSDWQIQARARRLFSFRAPDGRSRLRTMTRDRRCGVVGGEESSDGGIMDFGDGSSVPSLELGGVLFNIDVIAKPKSVLPHFALQKPYL